MPRHGHASPPTPAATTRRRRVSLVLPCALAALAAAGLAVAASAGAQSGRRAPQPISPVGTPTPTPEPAGESESEGRPKRAEALGPTFTVYQLDSPFPYIDWTVEGLVMSSFVERLSKSKDLSASLGGRKLTRKDAHEIAKKETVSHVLLVELTEDRMDGGSVGQADTRRLGLKTYVYAPGGSLKFVDHTYQRPLQQTTSIGGVRLPLPVPRRRVERFPNELELEQAARDAADRVMLRFNVRLPPD